MAGIASLKNRFSLLLAAGLVGAAISSAWGATASSEKPSKFRTTAVIDVGSNLYPVGSESHSASSSLVLVPSYRLHPNWTLGMTLSASKDWTGEGEVALLDPSIKLSRSAFTLNSIFSAAPAFGIVVPLSERTRDRESMLTAVRPSLRVNADLSRVKKSVIQDLSLMYELAVSRAFHQYSTSTTGSVNTAWRLSNYFSASYAISSKFSFSGEFVRASGWSYQGGARHSFSLGQSLNYDFDPRVSLSIGHSNEGDVLRANGLDSNVSIFDSNSSRVFTSLTVIF